MPSKYGNIRVLVDGLKIDSIAESERYLVLKQEVKDGDIAELELQPKFLLLEGGVNAMGKKYRKLEYWADFKYYDVSARRWVIEDIKGHKTDVYKIKIKLFYAKYPLLYFQEIQA